MASPFSVLRPIIKYVDSFSYFTDINFPIKIWSFSIHIFKNIYIHLLESCLSNITCNRGIFPNIVWHISVMADSLVTKLMNDDDAYIQIKISEVSFLFLNKEKTKIGFPCYIFQLIPDRIQSISVYYLVSQSCKMENLTDFLLRQ